MSPRGRNRAHTDPPREAPVDNTYIRNTPRAAIAGSIRMTPQARTATARPARTTPVHVILDLSAHKNWRIRRRAAMNKAEPCFTPGNASWANPAEATAAVHPRQLEPAQPHRPDTGVAPLPALAKLQRPTSRRLAAQRRERARVRSEPVRASDLTPSQIRSGLTLHLCDEQALDRRLGGVAAVVPRPLDDSRRRSDGQHADRPAGLSRGGGR